MIDHAKLFAAIKAVKGSALTQGDVDLINGVIDPPKAMRLANADAFYKGVRAITGALDQAQVDTIAGLLDKASHWPISWLAYGLATAWHEARLKPIEEWGKGKGRPYGVPDKTGQAPYGRGLVQLTWDRNYAKADAELNLGGALIKNYALALRPDIAADVLVHGMEAGWFTSKKLGDYLPARLGVPSQFKAARRIINGTDKDDLIAGYAMKFQDALVAGDWA